MRLACLGVVFGLLLAGCAAAPVPSLDAPTPAAWRHAVGGAPAAPDLQTWLKAFDDPSLETRVQQALEGNLGLQEAAARLRAARVLRAHARDSYLPWLRAHAGDEIAPSATASYIVSSFDAVWEFGLFGRREGAARSLQGAQDDAAAQYDGARVSLVAEVVADHLLLGAAQERRELLEQLAALQDRQLQLLDTRRGLGLGTAAELTECRIELGKARLAVDGGRRQIDSAAQQLATLLGQAAPSNEGFNPGRLALLRGSPPATTPAELLRTRPEIRRAEAAVLQAAGERDLARGEQLPNLGILGSIRWSTSFVRPNRPSTTNYIGAVGPLIDIPLFDWGLRRARTDARRHLLDAAVFAYRDAVLRGVADVENALGTLEAETVHVTAARETVSLQQASLAASERRVELKLGSTFDVLPAKRALLEAQLALVDARLAQGLAYVALYKAVGGAPLPTDTTSAH